MKFRLFRLCKKNGGNNLTVNVGQNKEINIPSLLTAGDFMNIQTNYDLFKKTTLGIAFDFRKIFFGKKKKLVEGNLKKK